MASVSLRAPGESLDRTSAVKGERVGGELQGVASSDSRTCRTWRVPTQLGYRLISTVWTTSVPS